MPLKLDFDLHLTSPCDASDIKVGRDATIQEEDGTWTCSSGGKVLGTIPTPLISDLQLHNNYKATIRSLKRCVEDPNLVSSVQIRISFLPADHSQPLVRAEPPPAEDPAGFTLTTSELERLAYNEDFRTTLKDTRLQQLLLRIDGAVNREQVLRQELETPHFRDLADTMLSIMKPGA